MANAQPLTGAGADAPTVLPCSRSCLSAAASLYHGATERLHREQRELALPNVVTTLLAARAGILLYCLQGAPRATSVPVLMRALKSLFALFGNSMDFLREDMACLQADNAVLAHPALGEVVMKTNTADFYPPAACTALLLDRCASSVCPNRDKRLPSSSSAGTGTAGVSKLLRCSRCKCAEMPALYCDKSCFQASWKEHKLFCGSEQGQPVKHASE